MGAARKGRPKGAAELSPGVGPLHSTEEAFEGAGNGTEGVEGRERPGRIPLWSTLDRTQGRDIQQEKPPRRGARTQHETPREQWIQIPVPALVDERTFDLAQERLQDNKKFAARRTIEPSLLQGLVHCAECGYALYRTSTRSTARKISYYRCLGSDAWRYQG